MSVHIGKEARLLSFRLAWKHAQVISHLTTPSSNDRGQGVQRRSPVRWERCWLASTSSQGPAVLWAAEKLPQGASTVVPSKPLVGGKGQRQGRLERGKAVFTGRPRRHRSCKEGEGTRKELCIGQQKPQE